jgi:hypothetical protein
MLTKMRRFLFLAAALALLGASGMLVRPLHRQQIRYDLSGEPIKGVGPDDVLATTALGAFRGIVVDVVWIRMENLKNEGKFFEIVQLADLACRLAPRFPKVWDFNAWNMAYNVSVQVPEYSERWPWVKKGIELLREEGIPNNPGEPELYFSLAWTFMHKVGDQLDDAHFWYKQQLGIEMHEVLGGGGTREKLNRLKAAPRTRRELLGDEELNAFYQKLVKAGFDPLSKANEQNIYGYFVHLRRPNSIPEAAREMWRAEQNQELAQQITDFARSQRLRNKFRMEPDRMLELMDRFGPFDWRSPFAHGVYWATEGKRVAEAYRERVQRRMVARGKDPEEIDWGSDFPRYRYNDINYDRVIYGALQKLVSNGRLLYDSDGRIMPLMGPDYRFTDAMIDYYEKMLEKYGREGRYSTGVTSAYENFLKRVTIEFFYMGDKEDSRRYYRMLRENFPKDDYPPSYDAFVRDEMMEYVRGVGPSKARNLVRGLLVRSYMNLGSGADERATALHNRARQVARLWNEQRGVENDPRISQVADFNTIRRSVLLDVFSGKVGLPERVVNGLRQLLPEDVVKILEKAAEEGTKIEQLKPFQLPEKYQKEPD